MSNQVRNTLSSGIVPILVDNTTAESIPPYSIVAIGSASTLATGAMTRPGTGVGVGPFKIPVRKPDATAVDNGSPALFLFTLDLPISAGKLGYATASVPTWAQLATDTYLRGDVLGPQAASWKLHKSEGGKYGLRDIFAEVAWIDRLGGGGGGGGGEFYGFQLTAAITAANVSVTADIYTLSEGSFVGPIASGATLYDPAKWYGPADSGTRGICCLQGGKYYALQSACAPGA